MDDFLNGFSKASTEPYEGPYKASEIFKLTRDALLDSLAPVFHQIKKAANAGQDYVDIKEDLTDDQKWILEKYGYDVSQYDERDEKYNQWHLSWFRGYYDDEDRKEGEE
jgi:hypothetical protein